MKFSCIFDWFRKNLSMFIIINFPTFLNSFEKLFIWNIRNLVFLKFLSCHNHFEWSIFTLTTSTTQYLYKIWLIFRDVGLNDMHTTFLIDLGIINSKISSSWKCRTDKSDPIFSTSIVYQWISHFWRHFFGNFIDACSELIELWRTWDQVKLFLSFKEDKNRSLSSSDSMNSFK